MGLAPPLGLRIDRLGGSSQFIRGLVAVVVCCLVVLCCAVCCSCCRVVLACCLLFVVVVITDVLVFPEGMDTEDNAKVPTNEKLMYCAMVMRLASAFYEQALG